MESGLVAIHVLPDAMALMHVQKKNHVKQWCVWLANVVKMLYKYLAMQQLQAPDRSVNWIAMIFVPRLKETEN